ncbi:hypothetical protein MN608_10850 [Microdochium nivale]|nr:hypothetical protein MN608_10850 [Microdochium nivale]
MPDRPLPACNDTEHTSRPSRLLQLPAELRLEIYDYVLRQSHQHKVHWKAPARRLRPRPHYTGHLPSATPLLLVCHTIYYEFAPLFYATSAVVFRCDRDPVGRSTDYIDWLRALHGSLRCNTLARSTLYHSRKMHVCIDAPIWPAAAHLWISILGLVAARTTGHLRYLTLTFCHWAPFTNDDSDNPGEQLVSRPLWPADKLGSEPEEFEDRRSVDLSENMALAKIVCAFRGLSRLDILGLRDDAWLAVFDVNLDPGLEILRDGFRSMATLDNKYGLPQKKFGVFCEKKNMLV